MDAQKTLCLWLTFGLFIVGVLNQDSNSLDDVKDKRKFDPQPELFSQDVNTENGILIEHPVSVFEYDEYLEPSEVWKVEYTATESLSRSTNPADSNAMFLLNTQIIDELSDSDLISSVEELNAATTTSSLLAVANTEIVIISQSVQKQESLISSMLLEPTPSVSAETNMMVEMIMSKMESSAPATSVSTQMELESSQRITASSEYSGQVSLETSYLNYSVQPLVSASSESHMVFSLSQSMISSEVNVTSRSITENADIFTTNISLITKDIMLSDMELSTPILTDDKLDYFTTESSFPESMTPRQPYSLNLTYLTLTPAQYSDDTGSTMTSMVIYPSISVSTFPVKVSSASESDVIAFPSTSTEDYSITIVTWTEVMDSYDETASSVVMFYSHRDSGDYFNTDSSNVVNQLSTSMVQPSARGFSHLTSISSLVENDITQIEVTMGACQSDNFQIDISSIASVIESDFYQQEISTGVIAAETDILSESYDFQIDITSVMSEDYSIPVEISPSHSFIDKSNIEMTPWFTDSEFFQKELTEITSLFEESIFETVLKESSSEITPMMASSSVVQVMSTQTTPIDGTVLVQPAAIKKDITVMIVLDGDCSILTGPNNANHNALTAFSLSFKLQLESILYPSSDSVYINEITCGSVRVLVTITNASDALSEGQLRRIIVDESFVVSVNYSGVIETFSAVEVQIIQNGTQATPTPRPEPPGGIDDIDVIVIIVACCICAVLLVLGVIICIKQWYRKTRAQSFDLIDTPHVNLKMEDFTLTRIPRPRAIYNEGGNAMPHSYSGAGGRPYHKTNGHQSTPSAADTVELNDIGIEDKSPLSIAKSSSRSNLSHPRESITSTSSSVQANDLSYSRSSEALVPHSDTSAHGAVNPIYSADDEGAAMFVSDSDKDNSSQQ